MPAGTRVHDCVIAVTSKGKTKRSAIRICQASTGQSYMTGKPSKTKKKKKQRHA